MPGAFLTEPPSQPYRSHRHDPPPLRGESVNSTGPCRSRSFRQWARQKLLHRSNSEGRIAREDDSGYDSGSLSSSSGSDLQLYEHPTHGKPGLSIRDTDDFLTVKNPNPHTGEMSPSVLSLVSERSEPAPAIPVPPTSAETKSKERSRWRTIGRAVFNTSSNDRPPTPPEHGSIPPPVPPKVSVQDEEPPDALESATHPLQSQPHPTHYAAFDPDHLRMPGALLITPPPKTVTNVGTDAISTWVESESRRVFELPAGPLTPGDGPPICAPAPQRPEPAGPRVMRSQPKSQIEVPTLARARSYGSDSSREAFCVQPRQQQVQGPRPDRAAAAAAQPIRRRVCSIPRKPVAQQNAAAATPFVPDDIMRPPPAVYSPPPVRQDPPPPPPPPHRYEAGRPVHRGEWRHAPERVQSPPPAVTNSHATQTRATASSATFRRHPIRPSYETPTVRAHTRLNGTGVQRIVVTTGARKVEQKEEEQVVGRKQEQVQKQAQNLERDLGQTRQERKQPEPEPTVVKPSQKTKTQASPAKQATDKPKTARKLTKPPTAESKSKPKTKSSSSSTEQKKEAKPPAVPPKIPTTTTKTTMPKPSTKPAAAGPANTSKTTTSKHTANTTTTPATKPSSTAPPEPPKTATTTLSALAARHAAWAAAVAAANAKATAPPPPPASTTAERAEADADERQQQPPLIRISVSKEALVRMVQCVGIVWAVVAGWYLLNAVGRALVVVLWPVGWVLKGVGRLGGLVRGGGWGG